jgi:hypothetical protein
MNTNKNSQFLKTSPEHTGAWNRSVQACRNMAAKFNQLSARLMEKLAVEAQGLVSEPALERAVVEAGALAWSTPYPLLFLPALAEEKVLNARQWAGQQQEIFRRQQALAAVL